MSKYYMVRLKTGRQFRADSVESAGAFFIIKGTWECEEMRLPAAEVERIWVPHWDWYNYRGKIIDGVLWVVAIVLTLVLLDMIIN